MTVLRPFLPAILGLVLCARAAEEPPCAQAPLWYWESKADIINLVDASGKKSPVTLPWKKAYPQGAFWSKATGQLIAYANSNKQCQFSFIDPRSARVTDVLKLAGPCRAMRMSEGKSQFVALLATGKAVRGVAPVEAVLIDAASRRIVGKYDLSGYQVSTSGETAFPKEHGISFRGFDGLYPARILMSASGRRLAMQLYKSEKGKALDEQFRIFWADPAREPARITIDAVLSIRDFHFSADEKKLLVLADDYKAKNAATLVVYDCDSGAKLASTPVGKNGWRLHRIGSHSGFALFTEKELRFVTEDGALYGDTIPTRSGDEAAGGVPDYIGYGNFLLAGEHLWPVSLLKGNGEPSHKLALFDLEKGKLLHIVKIGRASVRRNKVLKMVAAGSGAGFVALAQGMHRPGTTDMVSTEDGKRLYVFDRASNDITVVNPQDGEAVSYIPVHNATSDLWLAKGSSWLFALRNGTMQVIDTAAGDKLQEVPLKGGRILDLDTCGNTRMIVTLEKARFVWDMKTGKLLSGEGGATSQD